MNNAYLNITVRVAGQQAMAQMKALNAQTRGLGAAGGVAASGMAPLDRVFKNSSLEKFGKNLQWTGRQIEFNFTLPLVLAGAAAGKWANENLDAMTRVRKVYGEAGGDAAVLGAEVDALGRSFELLSSRFGVHQSEVIDIGAAWAQAGSAGVALAKSTKATLETMILGEMDATRATEGLIAIQAAYKLSTEELHLALAQLNTIENATSISFAGLIDVMTRAGGSARSAGIDIQHLAAMASALVPTTGSAAQAGNALRTVISRIMAPTADAADVMAQFGINVMDFGWQSKNGVQRIEALAKAFDGLTQAEKVNVSALIASRWQVNRFDILMGDIVSSTGSYAKSLKETTDPTRVLATYTRELTTYLASTPSAFRILTTQIQNALARAILPMMPAIVALLTRIVQLTNWFANLSPEVQQLTLFALLAVAAIGPLARYIGALSLLGSVAGKAMGFLAVMFSRQAAAATVAAAANAANAGEVHGLALAAARARVFMDKMFVGMWKFITLPFAAVGKLMSLMWVGLIKGSQGAASALGIVWRQILNIPKLMGGAARGVGLAFDMIWTAGSLVFQNLGTVAAGAGRLIVAGVGGAAQVTGRIFMAVFGPLGRLLSVWASATSAAIVGVFTGTTAGLGAVFRGALGMTRAFFTTGVTWVGTFVAQMRTILWLLPTMAGQAMTALGGILLSPWGLLIAAVVGVALVFRKQIAGAIQNVMDNFRKMPGGIVGVMKAVIGIISKAAKAAYEWLSYLNPFARHSPSIVEQVIAGVDLIARKYASLSNIGQNFRRAIADMKAFKDATAEATAGMEAGERAEMRAEVVALAPGAGDEFDRLAAGIDQLKPALHGIAVEYARQATVVRDVNIYTEALNRNLDIEKNKLDALSDAARSAKDELDQAKDVLRELADTPIEGMKASADAIFENEMAVKKQRLAIMGLEDAAGGSLDDLRQKMALLQGDIETLSGERADLRMAGAGSDILQTYDDQIAALEEQRVATQDLVKPIQDAQTELERLQRIGERLDLERSINFDPALRQIDELVNGMEEMPLDELLAAIQSQQTEVERLTTVWEQAEAAARAQQAVVDQAERQRDHAAEILDREQAKLEELEYAYDGIEQQIRDMESAMNDFAQAAAAARSRAKDTDSFGVDMFQAANGADFDVPGGDTGLGREGGLAEIEQFNKEMEAELEKAMQDMGKFDLWAPFRSMWDKGIGWLKEQMQPGGWLSWLPPAFEKGKEWAGTLWDGISQGVGDAASGFSLDGLFESLKTGDFSAIMAPFAEVWQNLGDVVEGTPLEAAFKNIGDALSNLGGVLEFVFGWIKRNVWPVMKEIGGWFVDAGKILWNEVKKWGPLFDPFMEALGHLWSVVTFTFKAIVGAATVFGALLLGALAVVWPVIINVAKPIFDGLIGLITAAMEIIRGVITTILAVINGDWSLAWEGIKAIFEGIWDGMFAVVSTVFGVIYGVIKGIIESIINIFKWLYDVLIGHSIIPDLVNGILGWFRTLFDVAKAIFTALGNAIKWVWDNIIMPVWDAFKWVWNNVLHPLLDTMLAVFKTIWNAIGNALQWVWENIIQPVWDAFKWYWNNQLHPAILNMKSAFETVWNVIGNSLKWVWNNLIKPIWDGMVSIWDNVLKPLLDRMKQGFVNIWNGIGEAIRTGVNLGIKAINFLIRGLNAIADIVPGLDFHINPIAEMGAAGGGGGGNPVGGGGANGMPLFAQGGITSGPSIAGEGRYPEFVIPTDPAYRKRAQMLLGQANDEVGGWGVIGDVANIVRDAAGDAISTIRKGAVMAAFAPFNLLADEAISHIPFEFARDWAKATKDAIYDWAKGAEDGVPDVEQMTTASGGGDWKTIVDWLRNNSDVPFRVTSTVRPGDPGRHGRGLAVDFAGLTPSRDSKNLYNIWEALTPAKGMLNELIYSGPGATSYKNGAAHAYSAAVRADHHDHVHAALAAGGRLLVGRRPGGTLLRVGEGRWDEEVQVKPLRHSDTSGGDTVVNFYGDLVFPNVENGEDAEEFIRNIEDLF